MHIGFDAEVSNQTELGPTNLTPGSWRLAWSKSLDLVVGARSGMGIPTSRSFWLENSTTVLEPGRTNRVDWVCPAGQSVRGEVAGIAEAEAPGAFVYAFSAHSTNSPAAIVMDERPLDGVTCGKDGQFHTARLAPGDYFIVALAYDYKQKSPSVLYNRGKGAELFGSVKVTITTNEAPPPVRIELDADGRKWQVKMGAGLGGRDGVRESGFSPAGLGITHKDSPIGSSMPGFDADGLGANPSQAANHSPLAQNQSGSLTNCGRWRVTNTGYHVCR